MHFSTLSLASLIFIPLASSVALQGTPECRGQQTVSTYIGKDQNVHVEVTKCDNNVWPATHDIQKRDNVCGTTCDTFCWTPSGGGPDPNECHVIADALLYDSQNIGALFTLDPTNGTSQITMQYRSCLTYIINQDTVPITYCRTDWSQLVDYVATNCQAQQNAHGGLCVATDQRWYIQVQNSSS